MDCRARSDRVRSIRRRKLSAVAGAAKLAIVDSTKRWTSPASGTPTMTSATLKAICALNDLQGRRGAERGERRREENEAGQRQHRAGAAQHEIAEGDGPGRRRQRARQHGRDQPAAEIGADHHDQAEFRPGTRPRAESATRRRMNATLEWKSQVISAARMKADTGSPPR